MVTLTVTPSAMVKASKNDPITVLVFLHSLFLIFVLSGHDISLVYSPEVIRLDVNLGQFCP